MSATRESIARALVRFVSHWMDHSYECYVEDRERASKRYARISGRFQKLVFPMARLLDHEAMGDQMAREGWWG